MTPVLASLAAGYGEDEILDYLAKNIPAVSPKIRKAKNLGYSAANILKFISNTMGSGEFDPTLTQSEAHGAQTQKQEAVTHGLLKSALVAGGGALAARAIPPALQAIRGALGGRGPIGPAPMANAPVKPTPPISPQGAARAASAQTLNAVTPEFQQYANQQLAQGIEKPLAVMLREFQESKAQESAAQAATPQMQQPMQAQAPRQPSALQQNLEEGLAKMEAPQALEPQAAKFTKPRQGELVSTPEGLIGDVHSIRDKEALVKDESGKLHKVAVADLESLTNKYKDVHFDVSTVPERDRSAPLYGISANRDNTALTIEFFPQNSENVETEYEYFRKDGKPIDEGILTRLKEGLDIPVTSGVEWAGFWNPEKGDSRGSANHKEIRMQAQDIDAIQSGKEANDPSKPLFFKKKTKLFTHGYHKLAKQTFAKHSKGFKKEYKEVFGERKSKKRTT